MTSHAWLVPFFALLLLFASLGTPEQVTAAEPEELVHLQRAKDYRNAGELMAAVIELKNALQKNLENTEARYLLGEVYLKLGKGESAEKELRRAGDLGMVWEAVAPSLGQALLLQGKYSTLLQELSPAPNLPSMERAEILALRGDAHLGEKNLQAASKEYQMALNIHPTNVRALLGQARLAMEDTRIDQARALIDRALTADAKSSDVWVLLGTLEASQGQLEAADRSYTKAMEYGNRSVGILLQRSMVRLDREDYKGAATDIEVVRKVLPDHPDVAYTEGILQFNQQRYADAQDALEQAINRGSRRPGTSYYLGAAHFAQGHFTQAETHLSRYLQAFPRSDSAARLLARSRYHLGEHQGAEHLLDALLARNPADISLLELMAKIKTAQGDRATANEYLQQLVTLQPESATSHAQLGMSLLKQGESEEALAVLKQAGNLDPTLVQADMAVIAGHLQAGKFDHALESAKGLQVKWPESAAPWTLMGIAYGSIGELELAQKAFERALQILPGEPSASANLATLALKKGEPDKARDYYLKSLAQYPNHLGTLTKLAALEAQTGNLQGYRERLDEAIKKHPRALQPRLMLTYFYLKQAEALMALATIRELENDHGEDPAFLEALGQVQLASDDSSSAVRTLEKRVKLQPESALVYYLLASAYSVNNNLSGLHDALFKGLELQANHPLAGRLMTRIVSLAENPQQAAKRIQELKRASPQHPQVYELEGLLALQQKQYAQAIAIYRQAGQQFPGTNRWTLRLGQAQWQAGEQEASLKTLQSWLNEHPKDVMVQHMLANNYLMLKRNALAREAFARVVELTPNNGWALNNLAWLIRNENLKKAVAYAERAVALKQEPFWMDTLGVLLMQQGETARALELLQKALEKRPEESSIHYHFARALAHSGQEKQARAVLKRLLREGGNFQERQDAEALLVKLDS